MVYVLLCLEFRRRRWSPISLTEVHTTALTGDAYAGVVA